MTASKLPAIMGNRDSDWSKVESPAPVDVPAPRRTKALKRNLPDSVRPGGRGHRHSRRAR